MSRLMLLLVGLFHCHLYISFLNALTIKHGFDVERSGAHHKARPRAAPITASIASRTINGSSGRALNQAKLLPRDDKMDDLFYSHDANDLGDGHSELTSHEDKTGSRHEGALDRLPLGDFTKTVDLEHLHNTIDDYDAIAINEKHHIKPETNSAGSSNSRHYYTGHHHQANKIYSNVNHHGHSSRPYGKYSPNMFANNYNLNYIHSLLTSKPSLPVASLSLQTMQSLLNSNPNGLTLPSYDAASSVTGSVHVSASSTLSAAAYQPASFNNIRGHQFDHHSQSEGKFALQQNSTTATPTLAADYSNPLHCGRQQVAYREPRIVGGNNTFEGEFPWAVSVQRHRNHHCGGVIVGRRWILTAAHCVRNQLVGNLIVRTGGHTLNRSINSINAHLEKDFPVEQIIIHDDFSRYDNLTSTQMKSSANTNNADIALLKLKQEIHWNEHAWPVCFPNREAGNFSGHDAIVIGWGKLNEKSEEFSNELQKVKLTIIDNKVCQNWFRQAGRDMPIDDRIICAGFKNGGKDACHGDSGGPLLSRHNGQYMVVGVVSTGIGCARPLLPGLYSRVSSYISWIERYITNQ